MKLEHIIFDFDGVIADTFDILFAISQELHPETKRDDFLAHHDGNVYEEPRIMFTDESAARLYQEYRNRLTPSHIQNALNPVLRLAKNYRLYIISSNDETGINAVLENSGLTHCFQAVLGYDTHKSKIEKFKMLERDYGVDLKKAVFITDTLGDIKEAKKLGITTIAQTFGSHPRERLEQGEPYKIVDTWEEVENSITSLGKENSASINC